MVRAIWRRLGPFGTLLGIASVGAVLMGAYRGGTVEGGGKISGTVRLQGKAPALQAAKVADSKQWPFCGRTVPNEEIVTGSGGTLANVVVWIDGITNGAPVKARNVVLTDGGCRFTPRVLATTKGSRLTMTTSDDNLNAFHAYEGDRTAFNVALPVKGMRVVRPLNRPGILTVKCDTGHVWQLAAIHVFEHPYFAVTRSDGRFELGDVPPGTHRVKAWHERLGTQTGQVRVAADGTAAWDVVFPAR